MAESRTSAHGQPQVDITDEDLVKMDVEIKMLQTRYEQFFLGVDRKNPENLRSDLKGRLVRAYQAPIRNIGLKFRIGSMMARYLSLERMWDRTLKEREEGTYKRDVFKAKLRAREREAPPPVAPPPPAFKLPDDKVRDLYDAYVLAKQTTGEAIGGLSFDALKKRLGAQIPELLKKHNARALDFKVVIKGGKALIRPVPRG